MTLGAVEVVARAADVREKLCSGLRLRTATSVLAVDWALCLSVSADCGNMSPLFLAMPFEDGFSESSSTCVVASICSARLQLGSFKFHQPHLSAVEVLVGVRPKRATAPGLLQVASLCSICRHPAGEEAQAIARYR